MYTSVCRKQAFKVTEQLNCIIQMSNEHYRDIIFGEIKKK